MRLPKRQCASWICLLFLWMLSSPMLGCDDEERFRLPEHQQSTASKEQIVAAQLKVKVPTDLPVWTELSHPLPGRLFQPEPVRLQGRPWLREGSSKAFEFYFQRENAMIAHSFFLVADSATAFLRQWFDRPFARRVQVVLMPEPDPSDTVFPWEQPRLPTPETLPPRVVIFTGSDQAPYLSNYGRVSALVDAATRVLLNQHSQPQPKLFWRSVVIPAYFAFRGICAMLDAEYNKTALPKFRIILEESGRPSPAEMQRYWSLFQQQKLPPAAQERAIRLGMVLLGYLEDHFSRGALAVVLRKLQNDPNLSFWQAIQAVTGQDPPTVWKELQRFYFPHTP